MRHQGFGHDLLGSGLTLFARYCAQVKGLGRRAAQQGLLPSVTQELAVRLFPKSCRIPRLRNLLARFKPTSAIMM